MFSSVNHTNLVVYFGIIYFIAVKPMYVYSEWFCATSLAWLNDIWIVSKTWLVQHNPTQQKLHVWIYTRYLNPTPMIMEQLF